MHYERSQRGAPVSSKSITGRVIWTANADVNEASLAQQTLLDNIPIFNILCWYSHVALPGAQKQDGLNAA